MSRYRTLALLLSALPLAACGGAEHIDPAAQANLSAPGTAPAVASAESPVGSAVAATLTEAATSVGPLPPPATVAPHGPAVPVAEPQAEPAAPEGAVSVILERVERTYAATRSMQATFVQDLSVPLLGSSQRSRGTLYQRQPDRFLMKFSDPAGDVLVADGRYFWMYYPSSDRTQVLRSRLSGDAGQVDFQREFLRDASARYRVTLGGQETVGGGVADVLTLVPRAQSPYTEIRIWVSRADALVRRFEMTEQNGSVRRIELSEVRRNPVLEDALFRFTPPEGTQVFDQ